ncbi:MAG: aminoacyl-tRNA hydrolase [Alphaproteobacteria bacterium]|nr:MAG: aminoacyl-tRNA hydrolase [Alphaproteobacteria bacterium]
MLRVSDRIEIGEEELTERFIHASGPGGQKVNKTASAVELRFDVAHSPSLSEALRRRVMQLAGRRINRAGVLVIQARSHRSQERNRREARERLKRLLRRAAQRRKKRIATKPGRAAIERRLAAKARRGRIKAIRGHRAAQRALTEG